MALGISFRGSGRLRNKAQAAPGISDRRSTPRGATKHDKEPGNHLTAEYPVDSGPRPAKIGLRTSDLPPEPPKHQAVRTARAFVDVVWELRGRDEQEPCERTKFDPPPFGALLEQASFYPGRTRARSGEIRCRDDSWRWAQTRRMPLRDDRFATTVWAIWGSLDPVERQVLTLERSLTHPEIADRLREDGVRTGQDGEPTTRWVRRVRKRGQEKILEHPMFKQLATYKE